MVSKLINVNIFPLKVNSLRQDAVVVAVAVEVSSLRQDAVVVTVAVEVSSLRQDEWHLAITNLYQKTNYIMYIWMPTASRLSSRLTTLHWSRVHGLCKSDI